MEKADPYGTLDLVAAMLTTWTTVVRWIGDCTAWWWLVPANTHRSCTERLGLICTLAVPVAEVIMVAIGCHAALAEDRCCRLTWTAAMRWPARVSLSWVRTVIAAP